MNAAVVLCKCPKVHKLYGVRFEEREGTWFYNWAFPIKESSAKREGYDKCFIKGQVYPTSDYPGCPYCEENGFIICSCGKLCCNIPGKKEFTCEWCGRTGTIVDYDGSGFASQEDL